MIPMTDEALVLALRKRDGKQRDLPHKNPHAPGGCPYYMKYLLRGEKCPWCLAQENRERYANITKVFKTAGEILGKAERDARENRTFLGLKRFITNAKE